MRSMIAGGVPAGAIEAAASQTSFLQAILFAIIGGLLLVGDGPMLAETKARWTPFLALDWL